MPPAQPELGFSCGIGDQRIIDHDLCTGRAQRFDHWPYRSMPQVVRIVLEGQAEDHDLRGVRILAQIGQPVPDEAVGVAGHRVVGLPACLGQAEPDAVLLASAPQDPRILGEAGAADTDARQQNIYVAAALRQGIRAGDDIEDVDVKGSAQLRQFVGQAIMTSFHQLSASLTIPAILGAREDQTSTLRLRPITRGPRSALSSSQPPMTIGSVRN